MVCGAIDRSVDRGAAAPLGASGRRNAAAIERKKSISAATESEAPAFSTLSILLQF